MLSSRVMKTSLTDLALWQHDDVKTTELCRTIKQIRIAVLRIVVGLGLSSALRLRKIFGARRGGYFG